MSWVAGASGDWDVSANWNCNPALPGPADDVTINPLSAITVTHSQGSDSINSLNCGDALLFSGGALSIAGTSQLTGTLTINGGAINFNGTGGVAGTASLSGGTLAGSGAASFSNLVWTGGTMTGTGSTEVAAGATLGVAPSSNTWLERTIDNFGTVALTGNSSLMSAAGGGTPTINNQPGATLDIQANIGLANWDSTAAVLNNAGTLKKSAGTGTSTINSAWTVNNTGTIEVDTGTLSLQGGGTSTGAFNTAADPR